MKKKSTSPSALVNVRVLVGLIAFVGAVFLALVGVSAFSNVFGQPYGSTLHPAGKSGARGVLRGSFE